MRWGFSGTPQRLHARAAALQPVLEELLVDLVVKAVRLEAALLLLHMLLLERMGLLLLVHDLLLVDHLFQALVSGDQMGRIGDRRHNAGAWAPLTTLADAAPRSGTPCLSRCG